MGVVDLLGIISFFLLSLVVRKLVVGYLKDTNAGECCQAAPRPESSKDRKEAKRKGDTSGGCPRRE